MRWQRLLEKNWKGLRINHNYLITHISIKASFLLYFLTFFETAFLVDVCIKNATEKMVREKETQSPPSFLFIIRK